MRGFTASSRVGRRLASALALGVLALVGCSLFVDADGLSTDRVASDSGSSGDADSNSDVDLQAPDATSCDATFCDDFDHSGLGTSWTTTTVTEGMSLTLSSPALSPPNALRVSAGDAGGPPDQDRRAQLERDLGSGTRARCEVSLYIVARPNVSFVDVLTLKAQGAGVSNYELLVALTEVGPDDLREDIVFSDGGCDCPRQHRTLGTLPVGTWVRLGLETDFATATVTVNGTIVSASPFGGFPVTGPSRVLLGLRGYDSETAASVLYDDLRCTITP